MKPQMKPSAPMRSLVLLVRCSERSVRVVNRRLVVSQYHDSRVRITASETRIVKAVLPNTANHEDSLFGGTALPWVDETAFITVSYTINLLKQSETIPSPAAAPFDPLLLLPY